MSLGWQGCEDSMRGAAGSPRCSTSTGDRTVDISHHGNRSSAMPAFCKGQGEVVRLRAPLPQHMHTRFLSLDGDQMAVPKLASPVTLASYGSSGALSLQGLV